MKHRNLINSTLALILMAGCTDATGGTGVEPDDLAGIWTAESIVFTSAENSELTMDVANEGATMSLTLNADGTFAWSFDFPGEPTEDEIGTYTVSGNTLTISESGDAEPETITIFRSGDSLTLTLDDVFDFANDIGVDAVLVIILTR